MARKGSENVIAYGNYFEYQGVKNFTLVTRNFLPPIPVHYFCHLRPYNFFVTPPQKFSTITLYPAVLQVF